MQNGIYYGYYKPNRVLKFTTFFQIRVLNDVCYPLLGRGVYKELIGFQPIIIEKLI